jgi:hypothetical protein
MKTLGPAISFATSLARLPQNEHFSLPSAIAETWVRGSRHKLRMPITAFHFHCASFDFAVAVGFP